MIPLMRLAFSVIADHPILGVGSNNFPVAMLGYLSGELRSQLAFRFIAHNKCLLIWAETGIVGLAAFLAFLFGALRRMLESSRPAPLAAGSRVSRRYCRGAGAHERRHFPQPADSTVSVIIGCPVCCYAWSSTQPVTTMLFLHHLNLALLVIFLSSRAPQRRSHQLGLIK